MKKIPYCLAAALLCGIAGKSFSQSKIETLQAPPSKIVIDGDLKDWGDSLRYYNIEKKINYAIANTRDTLYMAIRINDRSEQTRILRAGLTFSIDPKGKKKETYSITFPLNVQGNSSAPVSHMSDAPGDISQQDRDELLRERLTTLRGIKVEGFKDVEDEMITTSNTYGIRTAVNYDENGYLVCEAAIPISFFHADDLNKNEWAFNFRINGIQRKVPTQATGDENSEGHSGRGGGGGGGGMGGGGRHGGHGGSGSHSSDNTDDSRSTLYTSEDFWEKFYLAK